VIPSHSFERLRNLPVRKIIRALERDGFAYRKKKGAGRLYRHPDGRRAVIHYHHGSDTLPDGTLRSVLEGTRWTEEDAKRLELL
jgi:predicted RNA binding protein YcfA (HicA-like mRNA interferase family)